MMRNNCWETHRGVFLVALISCALKYYGYQKSGTQLKSFRYKNGNLVRISDYATKLTGTDSRVALSGTKIGNCKFASCCQVAITITNNNIVLNQSCLVLSLRNKSV